MKGKALAVEIGAQLSICDARGDSDGALRGIERNHFVHRLQRQEAIFTVGNVVEAMPRAEHFQLGSRLDVVLHLCERSGSLNPVSAVLDIAGN